MDCLVCPDMAPRCHRGNGCRIAANVSSKDNQALKEIVCQCVTESEYEHTQTHTLIQTNTLSVIRDLMCESRSEQKELVLSGK